MQIQYDINDKDNKSQPDPRIINESFGNNDDNKTDEIVEVEENAPQSFQVRQMVEWNVHRFLEQRAIQLHIFMIIMFSNLFYR